MRLLKGIQHDVMLKLNYLELVVLIVSDRFIVFPLKFGNILKHPCEFAVVPWVPWPTVWELLCRPVRYHLCFFSLILAIPILRNFGHSHVLRFSHFFV